MKLVDKVWRALQVSGIAYEFAHPAMIDEEAGTWFEPPQVSVLTLWHDSHGRATLVIQEGTKDALANILRIGGESWSILENVLSEVMLAEVNR